jgi:hypothetical protein
VSEFDAAIQVQIKASREAAVQFVGKAGALVVAFSQKHAYGGRPSSINRSSSYARSFHTEGPKDASAGVVYSESGPSMIYSRRLDLGYMNMTDSLGRLYHQIPYPALAPGVKDATVPISNLAEAMFGAALGG